MTDQDRGPSGAAARYEPAPGDPMDDPFPNEPTIDDPSLELPGEDPGALEVPPALAEEGELRT